MVRVWYMDNSDSDQRLEHFKVKDEFIGIEELKKKSGVLYWKLNLDTFEMDGSLEKIKKDRGYSYQDVLEISPEKLENYEEKIKIFFKEHLHTDEEIRFILDGSGYFDVRDNNNDEWIRIEVNKGDLLILPPGIYHRFTLDQKNYIKAMRLFIGEPIWTPHNRPCDEMECRKEYVEKMKKEALMA